MSTLHIHTTGNIGITTGAATGSLLVGSGGAGGGTYTTIVSAYSGPGYSIGYPAVNISNNDITINGESLKEFMHQVQDYLGIMRPNPELEKEFEELRKCAEKYRKLEKKFLEQKKVWDTLKK